MPAAIQVRNLHHRYRGAGDHPPAVGDVSFDVPENQFFTLLGPSGCGKTTTLRCLAGLERPDSGEIRLGDVVVVSDRHFVPTHKRDIGMVFQDYAVWPHMTVFENVAFPLRMASRRRMRMAELRDKVIPMLELMGMERLEKRRANQLSGGQQQRLSLARALVREPQVLLLDEPLSSLDARLRARMRGELRRVQRQLGITTVFVTHDQVEALSLSNWIAVMNDGEIVQAGRPRDLYFHPKTEFVGNLVGAANLIPGQVVSIEEPTDEGDSVAPRAAIIETAFGVVKCCDVSIEELSVGDACSLLVRPESIVMHRERPERDNIFLSKVEMGLFVGDAVEHEISIGESTLNVSVPAQIRFRRGEKAFAEIPPLNCVVFGQ
ncbi:MAG TPA: ABC transporter ATP-binding protein [Jatrophihabitans sp.]|nr:ABC transporter ATP-binding protein [Jatrophihabitans sp.]